MSPPTFLRFAYEPTATSDMCVGRLKRFLVSLFRTMTKVKKTRKTATNVVPVASLDFQECEEFHMITLNKYGGRCNRVFMELFGLSTDDKPVETFEDAYIGNGSTLYTMDDKKTWMYSEENKTWYEV